MDGESGESGRPSAEEQLSSPSSGTEQSGAPSASSSSGDKTEELVDKVFSTIEPTAFPNLQQENLEEAQKIARDNNINPESIPQILERFRSGQLESSRFKDYDPALQKAIIAGLGEKSPLAIRLKNSLNNPDGSNKALQDGQTPSAIDVNDTPPEPATPTKKELVERQKNPTHKKDGSPADTSLDFTPSMMSAEVAGRATPQPESPPGGPEWYGEIHKSELGKWLGEDEKPKDEGFGEIRSDQLPDWNAAETTNNNFGEIRGDERGAWNAEDPTPTTSAPPETATPTPSTPDKTTSAPTPTSEAAPTEITPDELGEGAIEVTAEDLDGTEAPPPAPATNAEVRREFMIVNRTIDLQKRARELAEQHLRNEQRRGSVFNPLNWARKTRLRVLEEYYRQQYISEASRALIENNNTYLGLDLFAQAATDANNRIAEERAAGQAKIEQLRTGELTEGQRVIEVTGNLKDLVFNEVIARVVNGELTDQAQVQQTLREFVQNHQDDPQVQELFGRDATQFGTLAEYFATDLLETGRLLRQDKEANDYSLERLKELTDIKLANANWAAETQTQWTLADRAIAWSQRNNRRGWITNPAVVGAATSIGLYGGLKIAGQSGKAMLAVPGAGLLVGAGFAAVRRAHDLKIDRSSHQVDRTYGLEVPGDANRRQALERYQYESATVDTLLRGGAERTTVGGDNRGLTELLGLDLTEANNRQAVIRRMAEIRSRLDFSASNQVDLIQFQSRETVEQGRLALIRTVVEARQALTRAGATTEQIDAELNTSYGEWGQQFLTDRRQQDRAFNNYRVRQSLLSAGIGGATGLGIGIGASWGAEKLLNGVADLSSGRTFETPKIPMGMGREIPKIQVSTPDNFHTPPLEKVPGFADALTTKDEMKKLKATGEPVKVGDMTISTDENGEPIVTLADGTDRTFLNAQILDSGAIRTDGILTDEMKDAFRDQDFDILEHTTDIKIPFDENTPLIDSAISDYTVKIPEGTLWVEDTTNPGHFDLVSESYPDQILINDAHITNDGVLEYDSSISLFGDDAFDIEKTIHEGETETIKVKGPEGAWGKEGTPIHHREWYSYDKAGSQGNELRLYNSVFTNEQGKKGIYLDISKMSLGYQNGLNPNPIDVQQAIQNHETGFAFSLPDSQGQPVWVSDGTDGVWDGHLKLDVDSTLPIDPNNPESMTLGEFSQIVINQESLANIPDGSLASELTNREGVFQLGSDGKAGFIEGGRMVDTQSGKVLQTFATIRGENGMPDTIEIKKPPFEETTIRVVPKDISFDTPFTEIIPPEDAEIPIIPWVITPRWPLEPLIQTGGIYYGYFEPMTEERKQMFEQNRSKTLKENPKAKLNPYQEEEEYFLRQKPEYVQEIKGFTESMGGPMSSGVKAVIGIPVAGHEEGSNIYNSLLNYTFQEADKNSYEILLFVNHPEGTTLDNTMSEIDRFKRDYPDMPVKVMYKQIPRDKAKMAVIRKYLNDVALYRHHQLGSTAEDIILISNDADLKGVSPSYVDNFIKKLDNTELDGMVGQLDWDPESYIEYPAIHAGTRLFQYLNLLIWNGKHGDRPSSGANFAFKGSIYAGIGGYQINDMPGSEDVILGQAIRAARGNGSTLGYAGASVSRLYTSSRRAVDAWNKGFAPIEQWDRNWGVINDSIRRHALEEHVTVNYDDPQQLERIKNDLKLVVGRTLDYYKDRDGNLENPTFKKAMRWLGLEYKVGADGKIEITDISSFVEGIKRYQKYGSVLQQVKSGKLPKSALKDIDTISSRTNGPSRDPFIRNSESTPTTTTSAPASPSEPATSTTTNSSSTTSTTE